MAVVNPQKGADGVARPKVEYFIMNGHCFGFTNAVYNYCRRPMALHHVLDKLFGVVSDYYVDDRWGIEPMATIKSAYDTTLAVVHMLGIVVQQDKAQGPPETTPEGKEPWTRPELLGVLVDFDKMEVEIKAERRDDISKEIVNILDVEKRLPPGQASKLKGKLQFASTTFFGRTGRAFMRPLSERQYEVKKSQSLNEALEVSGS